MTEYYDNLESAVKEALNILGNPDWECPDCCEGCSVERHLTIQTLRAALNGEYPINLEDIKL